MMGRHAKILLSVCLVLCSVHGADIEEQPARNNDDADSELDQDLTNLMQMTTRVDNRRGAFLGHPMWGLAARVALSILLLLPVILMSLNASGGLQTASLGRPWLLFGPHGLRGGTDAAPRQLASRGRGTLSEAPVSDAVLDAILSDPSLEGSTYRLQTDVALLPHAPVKTGPAGAAPVSDAVLDAIMAEPSLEGAESRLQTDVALLSQASVTNGPGGAAPVSDEVLEAILKEPSLEGASSRLQTDMKTLDEKDALHVKTVSGVSDAMLEAIMSEPCCDGLEAPSPLGLQTGFSLLTQAP